MKKESEKLEIAAQNIFGICPMCGEHTMLFESKYSVYRLSPAGWITNQTDSKTSFKIVCPSCGYNYDVKVTPFGLATINSELTEEYENRNPILKDNPLGKITID